VHSADKGIGTNTETFLYFYYFYQYEKVDKVLEQAAQRGCVCPITGCVQSQVGWDAGQPSLVLNVEVGGPACGMGVGA